MSYNAFNGRSEDIARHAARTLEFCKGALAPAHADLALDQAA